MNKFLLIVLLIFVQSKKFNTFQEVKFRNLDLISEADKEKLRNNEQLKKIAYKYHDMLEKSDNQKEILLALEEDFPTVKSILKQILGNNLFFTIMIEGISLEDAQCLVKEENIKNQINECVIAFYEYDDATLDELGYSLLGKIPTRLLECKNS